MAKKHFSLIVSGRQTCRSPSLTSGTKILDCIDITHCVKSHGSGWSITAIFFTKLVFNDEVIEWGQSRNQLKHWDTCNKDDHFTTQIHTVTNNDIHHFLLFLNTLVQVRHLTNPMLHVVQNYFSSSLPAISSHLLKKKKKKL